MEEHDMQPAQADAAASQQSAEPNAPAPDDINPMSGAGQDLPPGAADTSATEADQEMSLGQSGDEPSRGSEEAAAPKTTAAPDRESHVTRRDDAFPSLRGMTSPVAVLRRVAGEIDSLIDRAGFGPGWLADIGDRKFIPDIFGARAGANWRPEIEVFRRGDDLVIHADLPGIAREDVNVRFTEGELVIEGERRALNEERREGMYRSERSYGKFSRHLPLPHGADPDNAKATFRDGVLEITIPAPEQRVEGRSIRID